MLRVTTLYASSASASAAYYANYLVDAPGEIPGVWSGQQAAQLGLSGDVAQDALEALLRGRDPISGSPLGHEFVDRFRTDGKVVRAVAGFDATFSAPKSVSVLWALTGDAGWLEVHDAAVRVALDHLERFGATTRIRVSGSRMFPETGGLTVAAFRQTTSRADDPQVHTHAVISAKVQTVDGRWWALDARYLKHHQRVLGGLYQSALRAGVRERFGVAWEPIVNGQADITGVPSELLAVLSKRTVQVDAALAVKIEEFRLRQGRDPSRWERAALTREAAVDTRVRKSGVGVADLVTRWEQEANDLGYTARSLLDAVRDAAREAEAIPSVSVADVVDQLSASGSTWSRADAVRTICDLAPASKVSPAKWASAIESAADQILEGCVNLDPVQREVRRRVADGRSVWIEPTAGQYTSDVILAEEEHILTWALDRQTDDPHPSATVDVEGLDVMQAAAARAVAGHDALLLVEGPAGTGKTTTLRAAVNDLTADGRPVFGVAPTAKAARVLQAETRMPADTIAKLLYEHERTDRPPHARYQLPTGTTLVVDEAGMIGTPTLHQLALLADTHGWRVALVGDPHQLQAVGRGGMFTELCATGRVHPLATVHRFANGWEGAASLKLRHGDPTALDTYEEHDRITPGSLATHLERLADDWIDHDRHGRSIAITTATNAHVDHINRAVQAARLATGDLDPDGAVPIADGEKGHPGDLVVTRRNDRTLITTTGDTVRNRDLWTVTRTHPDQTITVTPIQGHGAVRLPADYVRDHVRLGYAATEHGNQGATVDIAYQLVDSATTSRGLYVGATRGREGNQFLVVTDTNDPGDARDLLDQIITDDRADLPATTQRRDLAAAEPVIPTRPARVERFIDPPDWLNRWRRDVAAEREATVARLEQRDERRHHARQDLQDLQPALAAAREAWQPFQDRIDELEQRLTRQLRPVMHSADDRARTAGVGRRHHARRDAQQATDTVRGAQADIKTIRDQGKTFRHRLDRLRAAESDLRERAGPSTVPVMYDQQNLDRFDRALDAIDTWTAWNNGQPVNADALTRTITTLTDPRLQSRLPGRAGDVVHPLADWLNERGIDIPTQRSVERDPGLGR